jgi:hypothetical protein
MKLLLKNNVSRYKWSNSGKDVVGRMFQYLTSEYQNKYSFENWLDRVDKYKSDPYSPIEIKKFADKLKDMVCVLLSCTRKLKTGNSRTPIRTLEKMVLHS